MRILACKLLLLLSAGAFSLYGHTEYVVIVNPDVNTELSQQDVERLFLAKTKTFPDGSGAVPVNQQEESAIRVTFDSRINGKSEAQMKSYWAKLIFTGKAIPVKQLGSDQEILEFVANHPGAIGYIDAANVDDSVKVLFSFQ